MRVELRFFGPAQEAAGSAHAFLELPARSKLAEAIRAARQAIPGLAAMDGARMRYAVNAEYAGEETALQSGDVISFIPPVGGG